MRILGPSECRPDAARPGRHGRRPGRPLRAASRSTCVASHVLGLAIDIGTTTVVFQIIDLLTGARRRRRRAGEPAAVRRQRRHDPDLVRAGLPGRDAPGPPARRSTTSCATSTARTASTGTRSTRRSIVANSTMRDLFFGIDIGPIGEFPYKSITEVAMLRRRRADRPGCAGAAHEVGLLMNPHGRVVGAPLIASHVGADTAADLVAVDFGARHRRPDAGRHRHEHRGRASPTARATWPPRARPARPSRAACCASACPARTAPSSPSASTATGSPSRRSATSSRSGSAARASSTSSPSCAARAG